MTCGLALPNLPSSSLPSPGKKIQCWKPIWRNLLGEEAHKFPSGSLTFGFLGEACGGRGSVFPMAVMWTMGVSPCRARCYIDLQTWSVSGERCPELCLEVKGKDAGYQSFALSCWGRYWGKQNPPSSAQQQVAPARVQEERWRGT